MNIIELAKEAGFFITTDWMGRPSLVSIGTNGDIGLKGTQELERFATLVRANLMKQVMDTCEAEHDKYDEMIVEDDIGHDEAVAIIHLTRKLEKLK